MKLMKRKRGQKLPEGTVYIGRPTKWGNPYKVKGEITPEIAIILYKEHLEQYATPYTEHYPYRKNKHMLKIHQLKGKDLACWCGEWEFGEPEIDCHGVVLMKMANAPEDLV